MSKTDILNDSARRDYLQAKIFSRTPEELMKQIYLASQGDPRREFNRGVTATCQWLLGLRDAPLDENGGDDERLVFMHTQSRRN